MNARPAYPLIALEDVSWQAKAACHPRADEAATVLDRAANIIEQHGLCQGRFWWRIGSAEQGDWKPGTPCCVAGAISVARGRTAAADISWFGWLEHDAAARAFAAHLALDDVHLVYRWNDDPLRTIPGVVRSLREAAGRIRTGELQVAS